MKEIIVYTQEELDAISKDCKDIIIIKTKNEIVVSNRYFYPVRAYGSANITAYNSANIAAYDSANITAYNSANITAYDSANITAHDLANIAAYDSANITAHDSANITAHDSANITAHDSANITAYNSANITAYDSANITAHDLANVVACGSASVVAYGLPKITACGNCQVFNMNYDSKINVSGNARIVYPPITVNEFIDYYGIKHTDGKATLYKAVHKSETGYFANYNKDFTYHIGETIKEKCDSNVNVECSSGIHVAYLDWALRFGENFDDLAILEVVTDTDKIVVPKNSDGKVRTSEIYVVREVPLEECGALGNIIARRAKK